MQKIISFSGDIVYGIVEMVCDSVEDISSLPACAMGSRCYVIDSGEMYIMNGRKEWVPISGNAVPVVASSSLGVAIIGNMNLGE